jgi:hypothetical protein
LAAGHSFRVCCDGLWGLVKDEEIREIVNHAVSAQTACDQLVALAKERGGDDNISLILDKPERTDSVAVPDSLAVRASQGVEQWSDDRLKKVIATILLTPKPAEPQKIMLSALVLEAQKRKAEGRGLEALTADLLVQTFEYLFDHHISLI